MNNSKIVIDSLSLEEEKDNTTQLRQREAELIKIIEAILGVIKTESWITLKELIFDDLVSNLERRLSSEAKKQELNTPEIYRLNGQLTWAKRYSDLHQLAEVYKLELSNLRTKLNAKNN